MEKEKRKDENNKRKIKKIEIKGKNKILKIGNNHEEKITQIIKEAKFNKNKENHIHEDAI